MLRLCGLIAVFLVAALTSFDASADRRVALVIGNSQYREIPALKNPDKDAEDVSKTFRLAGFEVFVAKDLTKLQFEEQFRNYTENAFDQAFTIEESPAITVVGWCYGDSILSPLTQTILTTAEGKEIVLVVDKRQVDRKLTAPLFSGLHIHREVLGPLVFYEVSPFKEPRILQRIHRAKCNSVMTEDAK